MNVDEIKAKCSELLKKTSLFSDKHFIKLDEAFELKTYDMRLNFEFFPIKLKFFSMNAVSLSASCKPMKHR